MRDAAFRAASSAASEIVYRHTCVLGLCQDFDLRVFVGSNVCAADSVDCGHCVYCSLAGEKDGAGLAFGKRKAKPAPSFTY